jgi:hypothetical protein
VTDKKTFQLVLRFDHTLFKNKQTYIVRYTVESIFQFSNMESNQDEQPLEQTVSRGGVVLTTPDGIRLEIYEIPLTSEEDVEYAPFDITYPFPSLLFSHQEDQHQHQHQQHSNPSLLSESASNDVEDDLIPCENCNRHVPFNDYVAHLDHCVQTSALVEGLFNRRNPIERPLPNLWSAERIRQLAPVFFNRMDTPLSLLDRTLSHMGMSLLQFANPENEYEFNMRIAELMGGDVPHGIRNKEAVTSIVTEVPNDSICTICQEDLQQKGLNVRKTNCGHLFCETCIFKWWDAHNTCPNCLKKIDG